MPASAYTSHPMPIWLLNKLPVGPRLDRDGLVAHARRKTGLDDFGDDWFFEPLGVLIKSINAEARLSALGRFIIHKRLLDSLVTRLRAEQLFRQHPEILDIDLGKILVIAGLQRTGTTLLHRLLASNPCLRAPLSWEALNPIPIGSDADRIKQAKTAQKGLRYIAPTFFAIHPVEFDMPEEDILFLDLSFMSQTFEATLNVPSYASWLQRQDSTPAYLYLKKMLQLLHWQQPGQNTLLKSPHHMEYLDVVLSVFPDATIIQTHRDPAKTLPSFLSMVCHGRGVFSDHVDVPDITRHWTGKVKRMIGRSMEVRAHTSPARFMDMAYADLVANPIGQLGNVYKATGLNFDAVAKTNAERLLQRQVQNKYGQHVYRPEDFGLTAVQIDLDFGFYRSRYNIPAEAWGGNR